MADVKRSGWQKECKIYEIDESFNADHINKMSATRVVGGGENGSLQVHFRLSIGGTSQASGSLVSDRLDRKRATMLRDLLSAALADWDV